MVFEAFTTVYVVFTMVFETKFMEQETKTVASKPAIIFRHTGTMVSVSRKRACFAKTIVPGMGTLVCLKNTVVPTLELTIMAAKKTVSVAWTIAGRVLSIVSLISGQGFVNPQLVFWGAPARSHNC